MNQTNNTSMETPIVSKEFNWMAFWASSVYYAGKGRYKKGLILAMINFIPLTMLITGIYCGKKANEELTQKNFNWGVAIGVGVFQFVWSTFIFSVFKGG